MAGTTRTRGTGTRAAETAERKRRLLAAAVALAADGGYEAVQMRDVAARADVALGTLYRHFSSKDQLLLAVLAEHAAVLRDRLDHHPPRGTTPAERVADALRRACRALEREPRVTAAMMTAMSSTDADALDAKRVVHDTLVEIIARALNGADVDRLEDTARVLGAVWYAGLSFWVGGITDAQRMADDLHLAAHLLFDGR